VGPFYVWFGWFFGLSLFHKAPLGGDLWKDHPNPKEWFTSGLSAACAAHGCLLRAVWEIIWLLNLRPHASDGIVMALPHPKVTDIINIMEQWAPVATAEPWDNAGLLTGHGRAEVKEVWVALDASPSLLTKARLKPAQMLLLHHPPIFTPLKNLRSDHPGQASLLEAAAGGLNIFAAHTNLDLARDGVSHALAARLGLKNLCPLMPQAQGQFLKLVVFTPRDNVQTLSRALFAAGAGRLGNYQECSFVSNGIGQFKPLAQARPSLGRKGELCQAEESRLEVLLPKASLSAVLTALHHYHPYEEPAYDLVPLLNSQLGFGQVGDLPAPLEGRAFLQWAARICFASAPQYAGPLPAQVSRVAVLGGSGGMGLQAAALAGAQVFVSGEAGYHCATLAADLNICLLLLGHYASEAVIVKPWVRRLNEELKRAGLACVVRAPRTWDPWKWF
jgi:dinuclear metal center YbgI/SA1388 family protein